MSDLPESKPKYTKISDLEKFLKQNFEDIAKNSFDVFSFNVAEYNSLGHRGRLIFFVFFL